MKTKQITKLFFIFFLLLCGYATINAQSDAYIEGEKRDYKYAKTHFKSDAIEIESIYKKMLQANKVNQWKGNQYCKPEELLKKIKLKKLQGTNSYEIKLGMYRHTKNISPADTKESFKKVGVNLMDQGLKAYSETSSFIEFVTAYTGKNIGDIKGEKDDVLSPNGKIKDIDALRQYYNRIKSFVNGLERNISWNYYKTENCKVSIRYTIKVKKIDFPKVTWEYKIKFNIDCDCPIRDAPEEVKSGIVEYTATSEGTLTFSKRTYRTVKNTKIDIVKLVCCKGDIPEDEDSSYTEPISQPDQTIGYSAGIGFQNDFEEISYCFGVEYLKRISDKKCDTYLGGGITYGGSSFDGNTTNVLIGGPKIQWHTPINQNGDTQWVNGFQGNYMIGNQKNGDYKDKFSGVELGIYSGFNIQLNEDSAIGIEFPVITWDKIKYKPEIGADYEVDGTSLLLNKGNPLKLSFRHSF